MNNNKNYISIGYTIINLLLELHNVDIAKFLRASLRPNQVWLGDAVPETLLSISHLFDDLGQLFKTTKVPVRNFYVIQTMRGVDTSLIRSPEISLVFDVQQLSFCSQIAELMSFQSICHESELSYFHALWSDSHRSVDMYGNIEGAGDSRLRFREEMDSDHRNEMIEKLKSSRLTKPYANLQNMELFFEIVACFMIAHEVGHNEYVKKSPVEKRVIADLFRTQLPTRTKSAYLDGYFGSKQEFPYSSWQIEELFCDQFAFSIVQKICIDLNHIPAQSMSLAFSFLFASIILTNDGNLPDEHLEFLQYRAMTIQRACLKHIEDNDAVHAQSPEQRVSDSILGECSAIANTFAIVQSLQDTYINNEVIGLIQHGLIHEADEDRARNVLRVFGQQQLDGAIASYFGAIVGSTAERLLSTIEHLTKKDNWHVL